MGENVGERDGHARIALGVAAMFGAAILVVTAHASWWSIAALGLAVVLLASGALRWCPVYSAMGFSSAGRPRA